MDSPPPTANPSGGLQIRRRKATQRSTASSTPVENSTKANKAAAREFLSLLTPEDYTRAVAFMGEISSDVRIHLNTTMKRATTDFRTLLLDFITATDVETSTLLLVCVSPLSCAMTEQVFYMQWSVDWDRFLSLLTYPQEKLTPFITLIYDMSPVDRKTVLKTSGECGMDLDMFCNLLITLTTKSDTVKCPVCVARRKIKKEVARINDALDQEACATFKRPGSIYVNELLEKRDYSTHVLSDFFQFEIDAMGKAEVTGDKDAGDAASAMPVVYYSDASGQAIASKKHPIDTKVLCFECKREVYEFALKVGNDQELWHTLWQERLDLHVGQRELDLNKSKWWVKEKRDIEYVETVQAIVRANKNTKKRKREEKKRAQFLKQQEEEEEKMRLKKLIHGNMIQEALTSDSKWIHQELSSQDKSLNTRNLSASLEFETSYGRHEHAQTVRKNERSTTRAEFHQISGIPLTKEAASAAFGTRPLVVPDETKQLKEFQHELQDTKKKLDWRQEEQRRQREAAERANFEQNMEGWLGGAQEVKDKITAKYDRQQWLREQKIEKRNEEKRVNKILRDEMRTVAEQRLLEEERLELARKHESALEMQREAVARHAMSMNEEEQCAIDLFWGIPTAKEKQRRLDEFLRRQFEKRIKDQRAMMVAVGGQISVSKTVAAEVPEILGLELFRVRTLNLTGKEQSDDPLGKKRRPIGQRPCMNK